MDKAQIIRDVKAERRRSIAFAQSLTPEQMEVEVVPGWKARDVFAHFISLDKTSVTGTNLPFVFSAERLERWNDRQIAKYREDTVQDLLVALDRWGRRFVRFAKTLPAPMYRLRMPTLWGRGPGGLFIWSRVFDEYVHRQDIRRALGMGDQDIDVAPAAEFVLAAAVSQALPQMQGDGRVAVSLAETPLPEWGYDVSKREGGPQLAKDATARIELPAPAFIMAAAGRDSFDKLLANGTIAVDGDRDLAERFLNVLRIV